MVSLARECGLAERQVDEVALAVSEAATNALVHGYRGDRGAIHVRASGVGGELTIVVADDGGGLAPRTDSPGLGLGMTLIESVARRVEVITDPGHTEVHMVFPCPGPTA